MLRRIPTSACFLIDLQGEATPLARTPPWRGNFTESGGRGRNATPMSMFANMTWQIFRSMDEQWPLHYAPFP